MGALAAVSGVRGRLFAMEAEPPASVLQFNGAAEKWQKTYDAALTVLAGNVKLVPRYDKPLLVEGAVYPGAWLECGPYEGYVYRHIRPDVARQNQLAFFALQRPDGQLPASIKMSEAGYGQIQMVVPIAATAWEIASETQDAELLEKAYAACSRWDAWLSTYRNTRGTGLVEGFCTYDTGHDNSPRWKGIPNRCPDADAKKFPPIAGMPRICPDLSATVYGGRVALAEMAKALGKGTEADQWNEKAATIRRLITEKLYSPEDACFYDLDTDNKFIRIRGDLMTRVAGEHVVDREVFGQMWQKQFGNPKAFWAPYPLPSIALDDPAFVRPIPRNSWGGATQALTALRAPRWMEFYGRSAELGHLMMQWTEAISRYTEFRQQMDPLTGDFTRVDPSGYSPAALVFVDATWRLGGPRLEGKQIEWNVRPGSFQPGTHFVRKLPDGRSAEVLYGTNGAALSLGGKRLMQVQGTVRLVSDGAGRIQSALGISQEMEQPVLQAQNGRKQHLQVAPNQAIPIHPAL